MASVSNGEPTREDGLLKVSELAGEAGVPVATVKHYRREGLLPEAVKTSRNMAYYPPESVQRIRLIKRLQEERYLPLRAIRQLVDEEPERMRAMLEIEDRVLARALERESGRTPVAEAQKRYGMPEDVLARLEEIGLLTPGQGGYSDLDIKIIEAISRFRAGGYDERIGFTVYDTVRYREALETLVAQEVRMVKERLAGEVDPDRVVEMLEAGAEPLEDLIAALHTKLLVRELERQRGQS